MSRRGRRRLRVYGWRVAEPAVVYRNMLDGEYAASVVEAGAPNCAAAAANHLIAGHPEIADRFGAGALNRWRAHLEQRMRELAAALLASEPDLFVSEVDWSRASFEAHDVPTADLRASLECLATALEENLTEAAGTEPARYVELAISALANGGPSAAAPPELRVDDRNGRLALTYLEAALSGDRRRAVDTVLAALDDGISVSDGRQALMAAQREVGRMWHARLLGVAQEHFVSATTAATLALVAERAKYAEPNGKTVAVAIAPGNAHDLGPRVVADVFESAGWRSIYLGGELPADDLALGLDVFEADLLALSMSLPTQLRGAIDTVRSTRALRPEIKVLVGGRCFERTPHLTELIGADARASSPEEGLEVAARLVGLG